MRNVDYRIFLGKCDMSDAELAERVSSYAADLIDEFWDDITLVGILDHSFLGEATADF